MNLFILFVHDYSTKNQGPPLFIFFICTRPFELIIGSSFIDFFFSARPFHQKLGSTLIYFFICTRPFDQIIGSSFIYFILSLVHDHSTKNQVFINWLFLFVHDHSTKLGVTLTLLFIFFLDVRIFRLLYSWQILPLHFIRYVLSSTTYIFRCVHYIHWRAALIFRMLYPLLYEVLAFCTPAPGFYGLGLTLAI